MRLRLFAAAAVLSLMPLAAYADTVSTYELDGTSGKKGIGTVTIDSTLGTVTGLDITFAHAGTTFTFDGAPITQAYSPYIGGYQSTFSEGGDEFLFDLPVSSLVGYAPMDSKSCATLAFTCDYLANVYAGPLLSADLVDTFEGNLGKPAAASVTPEPSSIALLGTGLLGVAGVLRRRRA